jgi:hypothetical protein
MDDGFVQCPKKAYNEGSLIVQIIPRSLCLQRQAEFYHKCPRCLNRRQNGSVNGEGAARERELVRRAP